VLAAGDDTFEHFRVRGWMRVRAAFSVDEAAAMRAAVWCAFSSERERRSSVDVGIVTWPA